jgi:hypothetical protein
MSELFDFNPYLIALCALAALIASVQMLRHARRARIGLVVLQIPCALLLLATLLLRDAPPASGLIVVGPGGDATAMKQSGSNAPMVVLPGALHNGDLRTTPDLATELRRNPRIDHVHVIGSGLSSHDREAVAVRDLSFEPTQATLPPPPQLIELAPPVDVISGQRWSVRGPHPSATTQLAINIST